MTFDEGNYPTPTEMVEQLLKKGWKVVIVNNLEIPEVVRFKMPESNDYINMTLYDAYQKAFPKKYSKEIDIWLDRNNIDHTSYILIPNRFKDEELERNGFIHNIVKFSIG